MVKTLFNESQIQDKLKYLAYKISKEFDKVTLLITLTGGVYTGIELSKYLTIPVKLEFCKVSSYGDEQDSGIVELKYISIDKGSELDNILIIDDICDTGKTLSYLIKYINNNYTFNSLQTLTLLNKQGRREVEDLQLDYIGFNIDNLFVYGFGMDDKGYERNQNKIYYKE